MAIVRQTYYIYIRNLKTWLSQPMTVVSPLLSAALMFLVFGAPLGGIIQIEGFPTDDYYAFLTAMILIMTLTFSGSDMAMVVLTDILSGYFDKLLLAPINRFSILFGTLLVAGTRALAQALVILAIALLFGVSFKTGILGIVTVVLAATIFGMGTACIGIIIAIKTKSTQVTLNAWLLFMPLAFITTAFMPKELLSGWFKVAVSINPVDYVLTGVRTIIIQGWEWESILPGLWVLTAMTTILLITATLVYRRATA
jgi:ABC-2 type transport system permease protein